MATIEAFRSLGLKATKGQVGSQRLLFKTLATVELENKREKDKFFQELYIYKKNAEEEIARCIEQDKPIPDFLPHPDHIEINTQAGEAILHGPIDEYEKAEWDKLWKQKDTLAALLEDLKEEMVGTSSDDPEVGYCQRQIKRTQVVLTKTALHIMRRWALRANEVSVDPKLIKSLNQHYANGTDPK